jgi:23S rRNA A2030 N6-methylase RlmJ
MRWFRMHGSRIAALEEAFEKLSRDHRATVLEAEDLYEKARAALGRVSKRTALAAPPPDTTNGSGLDPISARILARRRGRMTIIPGRED